jgi:hypothetical protein
MPKLTMTTRPEKASVNNSGDKTVGVELYLDQITKAEPFASLFTIKSEVFQRLRPFQARQRLEEARWHTRPHRRLHSRQGGRGAWPTPGHGLREDLRFRG